MAEELNLYQKLAIIRKKVEVVQKNKNGFGYKYVSDDELLAKITSTMDKLGVSLIPSIAPRTLEVTPYTYKKTKKDKVDGKLQLYEETVNEFFAKADMVYTWVNNDNPSEQVQVAWNLVGQQSDASQCFGSGLTYSMRYFLLKYFNVATPEDDPDNWRSKQRRADLEESKMISEKIIEALDQKIKQFLADNPDKAAEVKKMATKYAKQGNYFAITEPALAEKFSNEFQETFLKGE